ncbi:MAG: peptidyl-prolyl cis-trans isomerase [Parabacteroides sp.]|nr:peptidyl-prolyl cis-trans isomerase [Parabacteroides sp.]
MELNGRRLYKSELVPLIPRNSSVADSTLLAESYIQNWVIEGLMLDVAERNLGKEEEQQIARLVEDYRNSLLQYRYQEQLVREKLSGEIRPEEMQRYYDENKEKFVLDKNLIKGLFLKIPVNAPNIKEMESWYKSDSEASLEKIEKYSVQYAAIYEYFYDRWVDFDEVMDNISEHISNPSAFLRNNKSLQVQDSLYYYFLNIKEYLPVGSVAPYDYAAPEIKDMLINRRKLEFLKNFENELYHDALKKGKVTYYFEQ